MHSVRIELAKLILVGTRITYQTTGDIHAGHQPDPHRPVYLRDVTECTRHLLVIMYNQVQAGSD